MASNAPAPPGLIIASLRAIAAGFPYNTPLLVPRADGEGYEPIVMVMSVHVGLDLDASAHAASGVRLADVMATILGRLIKEAVTFRLSPPVRAMSEFSPRFRKADRRLTTEPV